MYQRFIIFIVILISLVVVYPAFAHTAKIVEDFKIDIGWKNEPPITGKDNIIEITVSLAEEYDKRTYDMIFFNKVNNSDIKSTEEHLSGLANNLEAYVSINNSKESLVLEEDQVRSGVYTAKYTPLEVGTPTVHLYGVIKNLEFELTSKIEKVEQSTDVITEPLIPDWIRNNAKWWSEGTIGDNDFVQGLQFLIKNNIITIPESEKTQGINSETIPDWVRNNAEWWSNGLISDDDFVKGIQFLVGHGIIKIS